MQGCEPRTIWRRNSSLDFDPVEKTVTKKYHARYSADDEAHALGQLQALLVEIKGIRTPEIRSVNPHDNSIVLEHVDGAVFSDLIRASGSRPIEEYQEKLLSVLCRAYESRFDFDFDPSNVIVTTAGDDLVIIDPICTDNQLRNFSACVLFFGLIKYFLVSFRILDARAFIRVWRQLLGGYVRETEIDRRFFYRELSSYIARVISWNLRESRNETVVKRIGRMLFLVPVWGVFRVFFGILGRRDAIA